MLRSLRTSRSPLVALAGFAVRHPVLSLSLSLTLCFLASLGALKVQLATNVASLLPQGSPVLERFGTLERAFGATDVLFLAVESETDEASRAEREALVDHLNERVTAMTWDPPGPAGREPMITSVTGAHDPGLAPAVKAWFAREGWLLLDDAGAGRLFAYLEQPRALAKKLAREPNVPPAHLEDALRYDPLGALAENLDRFAENAAGSVHFDRDGYLVSEDGSFHILLLHAARQSAESDFCKALVTDLQDLHDEVEADPRWAGHTVHIVGGYVIAHRDYQEAFSSAFVTLASSLIGVLVLFALVYRSLRLAGLIVVCLLPALGAALGAASVILRLLLGGSDLSMIVTGFAAILIGLGVDFFIHIYNAYGWALHDRLAGTTGPADAAGQRRLRGEAALAAIDRVGGGVTAAACTSIATFLVLLFSHYRGMWELGAVCGIGLLIILLQTILAVPAFLTLFGSTAVRPSHSLDRLAGSIVTRPRWWATALVALLVASAAWLVTRPEVLVFERDPRQLRPAEDAVYEAQLEMATRLGLDESGHNLLLRGGEPVELLQVAHHLVDQLEPLTQDLRLEVALTEPVAIIDGPPVAVPVRGDARAAAGRRAVRVDGYELVASGATDEAVLLRRPRDAGPVLLEPGSELLLGASVSRLPRALQVLPDPARQRELLTRAAALDWDAIEAVIADLDPDERARRADFIAGLELMRARVDSGRLLLPADLDGTPLEPIAERLYRELDGEPLMRLPLNMIDKDPSGLDDLRPVLGLDENDVGQRGEVSYGAAGAPAIAMEIERLLVVDFQRLGLLALGVTALLVLLGLRSLRGAAQAIASLGGGLLVALAAMHVIGLDWNLMNISVLPLIIGIGIDNGIHFVHALRHSHLGGVAAVRQAINETGHPIVMTALTSIVGFGSLMLNGFRGIQTVGLTACIGIASCLVVALIGLPLLALWLVKRHETRMTMKPVE